MTKSFAALLGMSALLLQANGESPVPKAPTLTSVPAAQPATNRVAPTSDMVACCMAMTAQCLACSEQVSVADFCAKPSNAHYVGCEPANAKTAPRAYQGEESMVTYGGGLTCPVGNAWAGNGHYCLNNDLYVCSQPGGLPRLVQQCMGTCQRNPPGVADRCSSGGSQGPRCYSDYQCQFGQTCSRGECVSSSQPGIWCTSDYMCGRNQLCRNSRCVNSGSGPNQCYSNRDCRFGDECVRGQCRPSYHGGNNSNRCMHSNDCRLGQVCLLGQCQSVFPGGGQCNSCENTGCGFGERCVHETSDYSCLGTCRPRGGGSDNRWCSQNNDCGWGSVCMLGQCRSLFQ